MSSKLGAIHVEVFEHDASSFPVIMTRNFNQVTIDIPKERCYVRVTVTAGTRRTNGDGGYLTEKSMFQLDNDSYNYTDSGFFNRAPSAQSASISRHILQAKLYRIL